MLSSRRWSSGRTALSSRTGVSAEPACTGTPDLDEQAAHRVGASRPAHDDGHVGPRHALDEVGAAQQGGDVGGLLRRRAQQRDLDRAPVGLRHRGREAPLLAAPEGPDAARDPVGDRRQGRAQSVAAAQHDGVALAAGVVEQVEEAADEARVASCPGEVGPAVGEEARVGAAEGLHGHVGVADEHDAGTAPGNDAQQPRCGRGELLRLVDDDESDPLVQARERGAGRRRAGLPTAVSTHAGS